MVCVGSCDVGSDACALACLGAASDDALDPGLALLNCLDANGCEDAVNAADYDACITAFCSNEDAICYGESVSTDDCCEPHETAGCADPFVQSCVCGEDPYCCSYSWDDVCVDEADGCGAGCSGGGTGSCSDFFACVDGCAGTLNEQGCIDACMSGTDPGQLVVSSALLSCLDTAGCLNLSNSALFSECADDSCGELLNTCFGGESGGGDCCAVHEDPGCAAASIQNCVCAQDSWCCNNGWDSVCVAIANDSCGAGCGQGAALDCTGFFDCASTCVGDPVCEDACLDATTLDQLGIASSLMDCLDTAGCSFFTDPALFEECALTSCTAEVDTCIGTAQSGDCCTAHESAGCANPIVQDCVCGFDPFCCTNAWDEVCVGEAEDCGANCGEQASCCVSTPTPGCAEEDVEACVCALDTYCCDGAWDNVCVDQAIDNCDANCGGVGGDCCEPQANPGCGNENVAACVCDQDSYCCEQAWDQSCVNAAIVSCGLPCSADTTDCCHETATPGCSNPTIESCVCGDDPFCCTQSWDAICIGEATACGADCDSEEEEGNCCIAKQTPGCSTAAIESCVCALDTYCCDGAWDNICVDLATTDCGACGVIVEPDSSCAGICGDQAPSGCWCDDLCVENGDCCEDACPECGVCDGPPPADDSCAGICDEQAPSGCWCDDFCISSGDCCADACSECGYCEGDDPPTTDSCVGNCDGQAASGCWCDSVCVANGDCCADVCAECGYCGDDEPPTTDSCVGNCDGQAADGCWCDSLCVANGDCCADVCAECGYCDGPPPTDSCAGICDDQAESGCWCDEFCSVSGDCCADVCTECGYCDEEPPPITDSCVGICDEQAPDGCWCDAVCVANGDCCADACLECGYCDEEPPPTDSCAGNCDDQAESGCWCDEFCVASGDCCGDACAQCGYCDDPPPTDSCAGICDEQAEDGCWCDALCFLSDDCCADVCDECGYCDEAPPLNDSCVGICDDQAESGCWCDEFCVASGDCCGDACLECGFCDEEPPPVTDSCAGNCDGQAADGCYCDSVCVLSGDCCADICAECGFCDEEPPPVTDSCAGNCDGQAADGCFCDDVCVLADDCCDDVCAECGYCDIL
jgi:hypothetical protein